MLCGAIARQPALVPAKLRLIHPVLDSQIVGGLEIGVFFKINAEGLQGKSQLLELAVD